MSDVNIKQIWTFCKVDTRTGIIIKSETKKNRITRDGLTTIAARFIGNNNGKYATHCGIGEGSSIATAANTTLENEVDRVAISDQSSYSGTARTVTRFTHDGNNDYDVTEGGLFDSASAGKLLARIVTNTPFELRTNTAITVSISLEFSES